MRQTVIRPHAEDFLNFEYRETHRFSEWPSTYSGYKNESLSLFLDSLPKGFEALLLVLFGSSRIVEDFCF